MDRDGRLFVPTDFVRSPQRSQYYGSARPKVLESCRPRSLDHAQIELLK